MKKHILIILCVFSSIFFISQVIYTYSLFETERQVVVTSPIAKWHILVNNTMIINNINQENSFDLGSISWNSGGHVRQGKAAPNSVGTFEIEIDPTDTEVSFLYELTIDTSLLGNEEISIYSVTEEDGHEFIRTDEYKYVGIARYSDISDGDTYRINIGIIWNNNENNNAQDYELGIEAEDVVNIPVNLNIVQYIGDEVIIPYVEEITS